ncbi:beta-galactosidase BoGH2A precursor [mine drainage metagenome]|uniref:Beta-galactosidase BoGH2A n=1 Tax=mine drainage metagenome TaxID=410659 RepID=A0A1J5R6Y8_9ZZZZ
MKPLSLLRVAVLSLCAAFLLTFRCEAASQRQRLSLDFGWRFHLGDDWPNALSLVNSGTGSGPAAQSFADSYWRTVNLPHDWAVELPFDRNADGSHGFKPLGAAYPRNSVAWYRQTFTLPASDRGKRIWITFDGVMHDATVWVNGWLVRRHEGGYYPFSEDITDVVHLGGENTVAVRVDATASEGWFYEGAGIYRHVWLDVTAPVAIAPNGIFVYSTFPDNVPAGDATLHVRARVCNTLGTAAKATVTCEVLSPAGKVVGNFEGTTTAAAASDGAIDLVSRLASPVLWSPESPKLYRLVTSVAVGGEVIDRVVTPFGIRTTAFDPVRGFLLNGKPYAIHGTCNHQDHAGVGEAIPDALQAFRLERLKSFGCNAIRTSHNPPTPELLDACDRLGMLVLDESRLMGSDSDNMRKWRGQIRRDRNHPSVVIWCIANEQFAVQDTPVAGRVARTMQDEANQLDPTREVTYASPEGDVFKGINSVIEVRGWNYHYGPEMDRYHAEHPNQPNVGTEQGSVIGDRGVYTTDTKRGYVSARDLVWPGWSTNAEGWWKYFAVRPWLSGAFVWTGFDYRGEPTPYWWPSISSHFGILDTCGFRKDVAYYYQSWWTKKPVLHLLPHWNWPGMEGKTIPVDVYSNCRQVELFLNGASLGRKVMEPNSILSWNVTYEPGTLSARGYDAAGKLIASTSEETTGPAVAIRLTPDRLAIKADGEDVAVYTVSTVDAQGRRVPTADNAIHFALSGKGQILGVGNGDPDSHEPDRFVPHVPLRRIALKSWRWKIVTTTPSRAEAPEYGDHFDDAGWNSLETGKGGGGPTIEKPDTSAIYRAHFSLTAKDLQGAGAQIYFSGCDDEGWYFINGKFVGETHDWQAQPIFDIKKFLRVGDNVVAVGVKNDVGTGGLNPDVAVEVVGHAETPPWSRSLFNGLAQIIVRSTRQAGEFTLTATSPGLKPAVFVERTLPCKPIPAAQ